MMTAGPGSGANLVSPHSALPVSTLSAVAVLRDTPAWELARLAGRIVELSGWGASARLTAAFGLVLEAQRCAEPAVWITLRDSSFFPPDAAAGGVDLGALPVVRVLDAGAAGRAADLLVRSGGFGLAVIDLGADINKDRLPAPLLTRLLGLAQKHETAVVILTEKPSNFPSTSPLVSLRAEAQRVLASGDTGHVQVSVLKDKRRGPGGVHLEACRGPAGVR
jgi:recombination protein RecA